ncbi:MAG TPA: EVE domain-containing protein [Polyangiaceae bacterium]|nr:EVE domain-containing protein [Polyangiaceae bacterium]
MPDAASKPRAASASRPRRWLFKSEPSAYSIADLERDGRTRWDGVRSYQARNLIRDALMPGDLGLFYHSSTSPAGVVGLLRVASEPLADGTQFDPSSRYFDARATVAAPRWWTLEVEFVERFVELVPLATLRRTAALEGMMVLARGARLSIQPVREAHFRLVLRLARARTILP